jgi:hypothetical protein
MDDVARLSARDRAELFRATAERRGFSAAIVEKDFWVCWTLKRLFTLAKPPAGLIFKGGTSLSKAFGVIERFSEDVDLSFDRADLGFGGANDPLQAASKKKQRQSIDALKSACQAMIREELIPKLNDAFVGALRSTEGWSIELDPDEEDQQTVLFHYPTGDRDREGRPEYIRPLVRLEMGARGEQWPNVNAEVRPYAAEEFPKVFKEAACSVKVAAAERTFWEKVTILHMWYHAPPEKTISDRQSRHYYDVAKLYEHGIGKNAIVDLGLLRAVSLHKSVFFARAWAKFDEAIPGSLRLVPPESRLAELEQDYKRTEEMIFGDTPSLAHILEVLADIERQVNKA